MKNDTRIYTPSIVIMIKLSKEDFLKISEILEKSDLNQNDYAAKIKKLSDALCDDDTIVIEKIGSIDVVTLEPH